MPLSQVQMGATHAFITGTEGSDPCLYRRYRWERPMPLSQVQMGVTHAFIAGTEGSDPCLYRRYRWERPMPLSQVQMGATHAFIAGTDGSDPCLFAGTFFCSRVAVTTLIHRYRQAGQTPDRPRTGRPRGLVLAYISSEESLPDSVVISNELELVDRQWPGDSRLRDKV